MKRDFLRLLRELEDDELRDELKMLYERFPAVKEYYALELSDNTGKVLDKYKKALRKSFFTGRRRMNKRGRSASSRVIKEFAAISIHPKDLVLLHLYRVEVMIEGIGYYRVPDAFYESTQKNFRKALKLAQNEQLLDSVKDEALRLIELAGEVYGNSWYPLSEVGREFY